MSNPFVRIAQNDDNVFVREPLVSSDLFASSGLVVGGLGTVYSFRQPRDTTTNVTSQDAFVRQGKPITAVNLPPRRGLILPVQAVLTASGPFIAPLGINYIDSIEIRPTVAKPLIYADNLF
jgi:hypothetical protein